MSEVYPYTYVNLKRSGAQSASNNIVSVRIFHLSEQRISARHREIGPIRHLSRSDLDVGEIEQVEHLRRNRDLSLFVRQRERFLNPRAGIRKAVIPVSVPWDDAAVEHRAVVDDAVVIRIDSGSRAIGPAAVIANGRGHFEAFRQKENAVGCDLMALIDVGPVVFVPQVESIHIVRAAESAVLVV